MVIGIPTFESFQRTYQSSFHDKEGSLLVSAIPFVKRTKGTGWKPVRAPVLRLSESTGGALKGLWTPPSGSLLGIRVGKVLPIKIPNKTLVTARFYALKAG